MVDHSLQKKTFSSQIITNSHKTSTTTLLSSTIDKSITTRTQRNDFDRCLWIKHFVCQSKRIADSKLLCTFLLLRWPTYAFRFDRTDFVFFLINLNLDLSIDCLTCLNSRGLYFYWTICEAFYWLVCPIQS